MKKRAVIYVNGSNEEIQEVKCRIYADKNGYGVLYVTRHIEDVNLCDVMLVSDFSRISRNNVEFANIINGFKNRGIKVESASPNEYDVENIFRSVNFI